MNRNCIELNSLIQTPSDFPGKERADAPAGEPHGELLPRRDHQVPVPALCRGALAAQPPGRGHAVGRGERPVCAGHCVCLQHWWVCCCSFSGVMIFFLLMGEVFFVGEFFFLSKISKVIV